MITLGIIYYDLAQMKQMTCKWEMGPKQSYEMQEWHVYGENDKRDMFVGYHLVSHTNLGFIVDEMVRCAF